jgi:hypothetical protein
MKKFPSLKILYLLCEEETSDSNYSDADEEDDRVINDVSFSIDVAVRFFNFVSKIDISLVNSIMTKEKTAKFMHIYF